MHGSSETGEGSTASHDVAIERFCEACSGIARGAPPSPRPPAMDGLLARMADGVGLGVGDLPAEFEPDLAALSTMLTNLASTMGAESEFGGAVQMIPPPDATVESLRRLAAAAREARYDPRASTMTALSRAFVKIGQHRTDEGQRGADHLLLALLQQPLISAHPTASADVYTLVSAMLCQPAGKSGLTLSSELSADELCATVDASMQCETADTLQAASQMLVTVARQPQLHPVLHDDRSLGCMFGLHDRSDDAEDRRAVVQTDVCLALALLLAPPTVPAHEQLQQEGVPQLIEKFTREHSATTHTEGGSELKASEVASICRSAVPEVVGFGQWCLARLAFNYPPDFISSGCWEALYSLAKEHDPEQRQSGLLAPPEGLVSPEVQTAETGLAVPETGPMAMQRLRSDGPSTPSAAADSEGDGSDHPLVMAAAHVKALEGDSDASPPVTQMSFTKKGKLGWSSGFGILDFNLTLQIHKADRSSVLQTLMLAGNQARVGIHPTRTRTNGGALLQLVGRNEKGVQEEIIAHAANDAELYQWLAGVRRAMDGYAEHGAFRPASGQEASAALGQEYDAALEAAIRASMAADGGGDPGGGGHHPGYPAAGGPPQYDAAADDEMAIALAMSMEDQGGAGGGSAAVPAPQPAGQVIQVQCPAGAGPGSTIQAQINGLTINVTVPPGVAPGMAFPVQVPDTPPPMAAPQPGPADPSVAADETIVAAVEAMGFSRAHAAAAAQATYNVSIEQAMEWCLSNPAPGDDPPPPPGAEAPAPAPAPAPTPAPVTLPAGASPFVDDLVPLQKHTRGRVGGAAEDDGWDSLGLGANGTSGPHCVCVPHWMILCMQESRRRRRSGLKRKRSRNRAAHPRRSTSPTSKRSRRPPC